MSLPATCQFNQEIGNLLKQKQYDKAIETYHRMLSSNIDPDVVTYNTMINLYVKTQRLSEALQLLDQMKWRLVTPSIVTYTSLIDGCGKCHSFEKALELYSEVRANEIEPNMHFFNALLNAAFLCGSLEYVDVFLGDLARTGIERNAVTYNTLVSGFLRVGMLGKLAQTVREMVENGIAVVPPTRTAIVGASVLICKVEEIEVYVGMLEGAGIVLDSYQKSEAVLALVAKGRLVCAFELAKRFRNVAIDVVVAITRLAGEYANFALLRLIRNFCDERRIDISEEMQMAVVDAHARLGNVEEVRVGSGGSATAQIDVIQCLLANTRTDEACAAAKALVQDSACTNVHLDRLFQLFSDRMLDETVITLFKLVRNRIGRLRNKASDCIVNAMLKTKIEADLVNQLRPSIVSLVQLIEAVPPEIASKLPWTPIIEDYVIPPPASLLFELMNELMKKGLKTQTWFAFHHFAKLGVSPSENSVELALQSQSEANNHDSLVFLWETVRHNNLHITSDLANSVLISALTNGHFAQAIQVKMDMEDNHIEMTAAAKIQFETHFRNMVMNSMPDIDESEYPSLLDQSPSRTRTRSRTCPRARADHFSVMEEISYRSAMLALGSDV